MTEGDKYGYNKTTEEQVGSEEAIRIQEKKDLYKALGFKDEKEFNKYNQKARALWKSSHRIIQYEDELSKDEMQILSEDVEIALTMKQRYDIEQSLISLIEEKVQTIRKM